MEGKWFTMWFEDKQSIIRCMYNNLNADLEAGYDPFGKCIADQRSKIDNYIKKFDEDMEHIKEKTKQQVEHWCYYDLKKRGAIA